MRRGGLPTPRLHIHIFACAQALSVKTPSVAQISILEASLLLLRPVVRALSVLPRVTRDLRALLIRTGPYTSGSHDRQIY